MILPDGRAKIGAIMNRPIRSQLWLQIAVAYFAAAVLLGLAMSARDNFTLMPMDMLLNLLGWMAMSLIGLTTARFPQLGHGHLAHAQFWLYNLGVPAFLIALAADLNGYAGAQAAATGASAVVALSLGLLACQAGICLKKSRLASTHQG